MGNNRRSRPAASDHDPASAVSKEAPDALEDLDATDAALAAETGHDAGLDAAGSSSGEDSLAQGNQTPDDASLASSTDELEILRSELEQIGDPDARVYDLNFRVNQAVAQLRELIDRSERAIASLRRDVRLEQEACLKAHDRKREILAKIAEIEKR